MCGIVYNLLAFMARLKFFWSIPACINNICFLGTQASSGIQKKNRVKTEMPRSNSRKTKVKTTTCIEKGWGHTVNAILKNEL